MEKSTRARRRKLETAKTDLEPPPEIPDMGISRQSRPPGYTAGWYQDIRLSERGIPARKGLTKSARLRDKVKDSVIFWHTYLAGYTARGSGSILNS